MRELSEKKRLWCFVVFSGLAFVAYMFSAIYGESYLYGDGPMTLYAVASGRDFVLYPLGRKNCTALRELFMVIALKSGSNSLAAVGFWYGFGFVFWPVLFFALAMGVCIRHKRVVYAELVFILAMVSIIFTGFYVNIESVPGLALLSLEMCLILLHKNEKTLYSCMEAGVLVLLLGAEIHFNENFCFWGVVLAVIALYRVFAAKDRLHFVWLLWAACQIGLALWAKADISARGAAPGLWNEIYRILAHRYHILWLLIVAGNVVVSLEKLKLPLKRQAIIASRAILLAASLIWMLMRTGYIVEQNVPMRFANIAFGVFMGVLLLALEHWKEWLRLRDLAVVCVIISFAFCLFSAKSGAEHRQYNSEYLEFAQEHQGEGFVDWRESSLDESFYRFSWMTGLRTVCLQGIRGEGIQSCIPIAEDDYFRRVNLDVSVCDALDEFGISVNYDAFD